MSGFGNWSGALFGGELFSSYSVDWSDSEWNTLMGGPKPTVETSSDLEGRHVKSLDDVDIPKETTPLDTSTLGQIPGQTPDRTVQDAVTAATTGGKKINWESWTFKDLREENTALQPAKLEDLANAWTNHGHDLKEHSETFKEKVGNAITGKWSGESATMAEAASKQVTKTSIYDFTPSSEEISDRLKVLGAAFTTVQDNFPKYADHKLIDDFDSYDKNKLNAKVHDYNTNYHFDGTGHLRNRDGGYVDVDTAMDQKNRIEQSIRDYTDAVQLFDGTYQPAIEAVAANFPNLPPLPNMKFEAPTDPTGPGGPGGPGGTSPFTPGGGPGGIKPFDKSALDKLNANKPTDLDKLKPIDQKPIDQKDLTTDPTKDALESLTDPAKSAMDTATNAAKDAMGQAMDAAKNAAQNPLGQGMGGPPEGVLGLGPQGLGGAGAGAGKGAGGAGGGVPLRGMPSGLPSSAPATAAAKMPAGAAGAGAGLGSGAGSPGAGAPAAGQRAGDQNGKGHQVNKALRRKKNGKDVIGDAEAAVPVVGADEDAAQAENAPADKSEPRRRIPQRGGTTWQPDSAVQPGPASPARGQQFTPGRSE